MAELQGYLMNYKNNFKEAIYNIEKFIANLKPHEIKKKNFER